ncbi:hypothetical protein ACFL59_16325 [Planctomycetota bacterium]
MTEDRKTVDEQEPEPATELESGNEPTRSLFGRRAIEKGYASETEVLESLRLQHRAKAVLGRFLFLGEILWLQGVIDEQQLTELVSEIPQERTRDDEEEPGELFFGEFATNLEFCTTEQLYDALNQQREEDERGEPHRLLGEILVEKGYLTEEQVDIVVANLLAYRDRT